MRAKEDDVKAGTAVRIGVYAVACPTCKVEPGTMCKGGKGHPKRTVAPHAPRLAQSRAKEALEKQTRRAEEMSIEGERDALILRFASRLERKERSHEVDE